VQTTVSRGRSIDVRGLSEDILAGRAVSPTALHGLLYQSIGARTTVEVFRGARAYAGYTRDTDNYGDAATGRWLVGAYLANLAGSGLDISLSDNLLNRPAGRYHSRYVSVGRQLGSSVYLTGDYTSSLSVVRFVRSDGIVIETKPETSRYGSSAVVTLNGGLSALGTIEYTLDGDVRDLRVSSGITYRFQR
jgi:hypothetical protein